MAINTEEVSLELTINKIALIKICKTTEEKKNLERLINEFFIQSIKLKDSALELDNWVDYFIRLFEQPLIIKNRQLIEYTFKKYRQLYSDLFIALKNQLYKTLEPRIERANTSRNRIEREPLTARIKNELDALAFLGSIHPTFQADNRKFMVVRTRIQAIFGIAQCFPEIITQLTRSTKLRIYHADLLNYMLGTYFPEILAEQLVAQPNIELIPPVIASDEDFDENDLNEELRDDFYQGNYPGFFITVRDDLLSIRKTTQIGLGEGLKNHVLLPFLLARMKLELCEKLIHFQRSEDYTKLSEREKSNIWEIEQYLTKNSPSPNIYSGIFRTYVSRLQQTISDASREFLKLPYENISYQLITAYSCDPQPELLSELANTLIQLLNLESDDLLHTQGLLLIIANTYRLIRSQSIQEPVWTGPDIRRLVLKGAFFPEEESPLISAIKSYSLCCYSKELFTFKSVPETNPNQIAALSAQLQYYAHSQLEVPKHDVGEQLLDWLTQTNFNKPLDSKLFFEIVHLLYTLNHLDSNNKYFPDIIQSILRQLDGTSVKSNKHYLCSMLYVFNYHPPVIDNHAIDLNIIKSIISRCDERFSRLAYINIDFFERSKACLTALAPILPDYSPVPGQESLRHLSFKKEYQALFIALTHPGSRAVPVASDLNALNEMIDEFKNNIIHLLGVVDSVYVNGIKCTHHRLNIYWKSVTDYLRSHKEQNYVAQIKFTTFKKLLPALWSKQFNHLSPDQLFCHFQALFNFMELNKVPSSLIFANIFHIYNELFLKISALDIYRGASKDKKEAFLNVLRLLAQHNNQLSRRPEIAYQRKKILSEIFGNEAIDTLFVVSSKSLSNAPPENRLKSDSSPLPFSQSGRKPKPPQLHIPRSRSEFFSDAHLPQLKELFSPKRDEHPLPTRAEVFLPKIPVMGTDQAKRRTSDTFHGLSKKVQRSEEEKTSSTKQFFATPSRHERKMNPVIGEASSKRPPRSRSAFLAGSHSSRMKTQAYTEQASLGNRESQSERTAGAKVTSTFVYGKEL